MRLLPTAMLEIVQAIDYTRRQADLAELRLIEHARRDEWTWREIADALGLDSPQAAQKRHRSLVGKCVAGVKK